MVWFINIVILIYFVSVVDMYICNYIILWENLGWVDIVYINVSFFVELKIFRFFIVVMVLDELNYIWYCYWMNFD